MASQRVPAARSGVRRGERPRGTGVRASTALGHVTRVDREARIFGACTLVLAAFLLADALIRPSTSNALAHRPLWLGVVLLPGLWLLFARGARTARALLAALVGMGATTLTLATSVSHALLTGPSGSDYVGLLAFVAGLILLVQALRIAIRGRRLAAKLAIALLACVVVIQCCLLPALTAGIASNAPRPAGARASSLGLEGAREVTFMSQGAVLSGWYVPGRNHAAVILLHGSHNTRTDTLPHLQVLARAGYAVLAFDARGHGQSTGQANALGWGGVPDIAGAVRFLRRQPGVDPRRIAALGLSMGAEESLRASADGVRLAAIIADGAGASTLGDARLVPQPLGAVTVSATWLTMRAVEVASGEAEPAALTSLLGRIRVPVLLIASNAHSERTIDAAYRSRIGAWAALWYVADAGHTGALGRHPGEYEARVTAFLKRALAAR